MSKKTEGQPPVNFLRYLLFGRCAYCEKSETETFLFNEKTGERKPFWVCTIRPDIGKGHIPCTEELWKECPLRR